MLSYVIVAFATVYHIFPKKINLQENGGESVPLPK